MMKQTLIFRFLGLMLGLTLFVASCVETEGNVTPEADLIFTVVDDNGENISGAQIFLFPFQTPYEDYLAANPEGDPSQTPSLDPEDVATTNSSGEASFIGRPLDGTSFPSGNTFIHQPNSIYFRVQAEVNGEFLTNDSSDPNTYRISFPDLESGEFVRNEIEVVIR